MAGEDAHDRAVELLSSAKLESAKEPKQTLLAEAFELVYRANAALVPSLAGEFLEFAQDPHMAVRKFVAVVAEETGKCGSTLPNEVRAQLSAAMAWLVQDKSPAVAKRAMQAAADVWHRQGGLWKNGGDALVEEVVRLFEGGGGAAGVPGQAQALKFFEVVARSKGATRKQRQGMLKLILNALRPGKVPVPVLTAAIHSVIAVGKAVSEERDSMIRGLLELKDIVLSERETPSLFTESQAKNVGQTLVVSINLLLKALPGGDRGLDSAVQALQRKGGRKRDPEEKGDARPSKRVKRTVEEVRESVDAKEQPISVDDVVRWIQWQKRSVATTPDAVVALIMGHMARIPDASAVKVADPRRAADPRTSASTSHGRKEAPRVLPTLEPLTPRELEEQGLHAYRRIVEWRAGSEDVHVALVRRALAVRLGALPGSHYQQDLLDHLMESPWRRRELLLQYLYQQLAQGGEGKTGTSTYTSILTYVVEKLLLRVRVAGGVGRVDRAAEFILCEAPHLPPSAMNLLAKASQEPEWYVIVSLLCHIGLRVLETLCTTRPASRASAMGIILQLAMSTDSHVRKAAVALCLRLSAFPLFAPTIESAALRRLQEMVEDTEMEEDAAEEGEGQAAVRVVQRGALYMGVLAEKEELFPHLVRAFAVASHTPATQKAILDLYTASPASTRLSDDTVISALSSLSPHTAPLLVLAVARVGDARALSSELVEAAKRVAKEKADPRLLLPLARYLKRADVEEALPSMLEHLSPAQVFSMLTRVVQGGTAGLPATQVVVLLHTVAVPREVLPRAIETLDKCFVEEHQDIYGKECMAAALQQLVVRNPVPPLFLRTVIQTTRKYPDLMEYILDLVGQLVKKRVWESDDLTIWKGVKKLCELAAPHSMVLMAQLPTSQVEEVLRESPALLPHFRDYCQAKDLSSDLLQLVQRMEKGL